MTYRDKNYSKALGQNLRNKREQANYTQSQVAKKFGHSSGQFISNIELGKCAIPLHVLVKIAHLYSIPEKEFLNFILEQERMFWKSSLKRSKAM